MFPAEFLRDVWLLITTYRISGKSDSWPGDQSVLTTYAWNKLRLNVGTTKWNNVTCQSKPVSIWFHLFIYLHRLYFLFSLIFDALHPLEALLLLYYLYCTYYILYLFWVPYSTRLQIFISFIPGRCTRSNLALCLQPSQRKRKRPVEQIFWAIYLG